MFDELKPEKKDRYNSPNEKTYDYKESSTFLRLFQISLLTFGFLFIFSLLGFLIFIMFFNSAENQQIQPKGSTYSELNPLEIAKETTEAEKTNEHFENRIVISDDNIIDISIPKNLSNKMQPIYSDEKSSEIGENHFSVELVKTNNLDKLAEIVKKYELTGYFIYAAKIKNSPIFVLYFGDYETKLDAEDAIAVLSEYIPNLKMQIVTGKEIRSVLAE